VTTNLMISHPDISFNANKVTCSVTDDSDFPHYNLIAGRRDSFFQTAANQTTFTITYDLGANYTAKQNALYHVVIARCDILKAAGLTTFQIQRSPDGSTWLDEYTNSSMASETLYGPRNYDFYDTPIALSGFTPTGYRYWRLSYTSSSGQKFTHAKVHFGKHFDAGRDPVSIIIDRIPAAEGRFKGGSGAEFLARLDEPLYQFKIRWIGLRDDAIRDFYSKIDAYKDTNRVFLYTLSDHTVLDNQRIVHCKVSDVRSEPAADIIDYNELEATFTEVLG
jgi:F5/8 type C domain